MGHSHKNPFRQLFHPFMYRKHDFLFCLLALSRSAFVSKETKLCNYLILVHHQSDEHNYNEHTT